MTMKSNKKKEGPASIDLVVMDALPKKRKQKLHA